MSDGAEAGKTTGGRVTRRQLLTGAGAAAIGGLAIGGLGGYALGSSGDDEASGDGATTGGGGGSTETIKLGSASPTTGAYSGDGQEMTRGQELAIAEINAAGGVLGRQLELVVFDVEDPFAPEKMVNAARRLTNEGVAATFSGYTTTTSAEFDVYAEYGAPMFHLNTFQPNADYVADNGITNIYHSCPTEVWYGPGFIQFMERLIDAGAWEPSSESAAVVTSNDPYSISIARTVRAGLEELGWDVARERAGDGAAHGVGAGAGEDPPEPARADLPRRLHPGRPGLVPAAVPIRPHAVVDVPAVRPVDPRIPGAGRGRTPTA